MRREEPGLVVLPPRLAGVEAVRVTGDTRLWSGVSTRYGVTVVYAGAFDFWYRGRAWTQAAGMLKLKEPGEVHRDLRVHAPVTAQSMTLEAPWVEGAARELGLRAPPHLPALSEGQGHAEALALHAALRDPGSDALALQGLLAGMLAALLGAGTHAPVEASPRTRRAALRARDLLHESVVEGVSLDALAAASGLGRFHLLRTFRQELGLTPHAYLTHLRISRARELLARGVSAARVALEVGLYDQSQLHRHFVRIVGTSPGAYARAVRGTSTSPKKDAGRAAHPRR
ncbi:helix-turn-helix transcriptional regulator [Corallococcus llansteffanensis]|uniref:AraC family transcriptional regulator n=1 Tax=Corallococcus llansteffanensis TaxID=2316731 RepID=A0A3A8PNV5_9BACT|nr:AraC family transcriptional regulator [Corallococcus llansteffanensis]RKH58046.1 AraC family transcriptional regulator [Corallococcus llansteffanensis]